MIDEAFLTTDEVVEYLQVNLRTVYRLIKAGKIPAVRVGRQWRFRKTDIDAWLEMERSRSVRPVRSSPTPAPAAKPEGRPRVLVVDDEASIRDLLLKTLALADYVGLDVTLDILESFAQRLDNSKYRPCPLLREMVAQGALGRKTGQGFFSYP